MAEEKSKTTLLKEKIMMTTVMALAVVAVMIAKAINVNNHIEMGK